MSVLEMPRDATEAPGDDTVEGWARRYVESASLAYKLEPGPVPTRWIDQPWPVRMAHPGRPPELSIVEKAPRVRGLTSPLGRARALHTFFHHELQAAELMCWALLAFPETPRAFRRGLVAIALDEVRHMRLYAEHIGSLGHAIGTFPVRDWFWERVPRCERPGQFVAVMGLGFEGGNLEHARDFAARFRAVGDVRGAEIQELVAREERAHVAFGAHWFRELEGELTFDRWVAALPPPVSPMLLRGRPLDRDARTSAGLDDDFLARLEAWEPLDSSR